MSKKYLRIEMPDGSVWELPAQMIAHERAKYYAESDAGRPDGDEFDRVYAEEVEYSLSEDSELLDFAAGNFNWSDVQSSCRMVEGPKSVDYDAGWRNGRKWIEER